MDSLNLSSVPSVIEMSSLKRNERVAWLDRGRDYTRKEASRHRRTCGVLKCPNCNFLTYSSKEMNFQIKMKHSS